MSAGTGAASAARVPYPSPRDWRREVIYFLLPDRFSNGPADPDQLLDRADVVHEPPDDGPLTVWYWNLWAISGRNRFQGGTLRGVVAQLDYLRDLGVTTLWLGPPWKQRVAGVDQNVNHDASDDPYFPPLQQDLRDPHRDHDYRAEFLRRDDYHGYAVQDFGAVDPRFGTTEDLVEVVRQAHARSLRVVLDIQLNHTGVNWFYDVPVQSAQRPPHPPGLLGDASTEPGDPDVAADRYAFGTWLDADNRPTERIGDDPDAGVWPVELQNPEWYTRRGEGSYGAGAFDRPHTEFRDSDYRNRDLRYDADHPDQDPVLAFMVDRWCRWIAELDVDGYRIDAIKHVPPRTAAAFTGQVREFARKHGKDNFLLIGEVGGSDAQAATYLQYPGLHVLSLDERRRQLRRLAAGLPGASPPVALLPTSGTVLRTAGNDLAPGFRTLLQELDEAVLRDRTVITADDHDCMGTDDGPRRLAGEHGEASVVPGVALVLFGPGVPCLYYGTEQALTGVPAGADAAGNLAGMGLRSPGQGGDRYLREAMFGPLHPRPSGRAGRDDLDALDRRLPGFGPFGTCGRHVFDPESPWYQAVAALNRARRDHPVLATGAITWLPTGRVDRGRFGRPLPAGTVAWARRSGTDVAVLVVRGAQGPVPDDPDHPDDVPSVEVSLPDWPGLATLRPVARVSGRGCHRLSGDLPVDRLPQSDLPVLDVGRVAPGTVLVLVGTLATAPGQHRQEG